MTIWTLLSIPVILIALVGMVEINRLAQARVQLENALEAAALAAVEEWGDRGGAERNIAVARSMGGAYAGANTVHGTPVDLENPGIVASVHWCFGTAKERGSGFDFCPAPDATTNLAVLVEATVKVAHLGCSPLAIPGDPPSVTARVAAFYDASSTPHVRLIRLHAPQPTAPSPKD